MIRSKWVRTLMAGVLLVMAGVEHARAQRVPGPPPSPASMLADQIVLLAQASLDGQGQVREDQIIRARILLDLALQVNPSDAEVWRLRSELARLEKDRDGQLEALRQYVRRMPTDDAAQLELLLMGLAEHQTLDLRIAAAVNVLDGAAAGQLSPAVLSRLASFVASSFHELGRDDEFGKRLAQALRLDPFNIAAARMAYELAVSKQRHKSDITQALLNLAKAHPADPTTRRRFGESLLAIGLGTYAAGQFNAASSLSREPMDEGFYCDWATSLILAGQIDEATGMLDQLEQVFNRMAADRAAKNGAAMDAKPGLPLELLMLRLAMLETPEADQANPAASEAFNAVFAKLKAEADTGSVDAASRLALLSLMCRRKIETVMPYMDTVATKLGRSDPRVQVLEAWRHFRAGDIEAAKPLLAEAAAKDPYGSYLVALLGDVKDARRQAVLAQIVLQNPSSLVSLFAARTLDRAGGKLELDRHASRIAAQMDRWPGYLRVPNMAVQPWLSLQLTIDPQHYDYLEPVTARLTLRNRTDLPLSIGDPTGASATPRSVLLAVSLRQTDANAPLIAPIVVDMGRFIRIEPQQAIEVTQRLDRGTLGAILAGLPSQHVNFSVVALYDPEPGSPPAQGRTGILGSVDKVMLVQVAGQAVNAATVDQWLAHLGEKDSLERYQSLARLAVVAHRLPPEGESEQYAVRIAEQLAMGLAQMTPQDQAWVARFTGNDDLSRRRLAALHESLSRSEDPLVRIVYVATHADRPDSPILTEAMRVRHPDVISFARALQMGLRATSSAVAPQEQ